MARKPLVLVTSIILFLGTFPEAGLIECALYYLNAKFGFDIQDNSWIFCESALLGTPSPLPPASVAPTRLQAAGRRASACEAHVLRARVLLSEWGEWLNCDNAAQ